MIRDIEDHSHSSSDRDQLPIGLQSASIKIWLASIADPRRWRVEIRSIAIGIWSNFGRNWIGLWVRPNSRRISAGIGCCRASRRPPKVHQTRLGYSITGDDKLQAKSTVAMKSHIVTYAEVTQDWVLFYLFERLKKKKSLLFFSQLKWALNLKY